jgi:hypothetical protein
MRRQRIPHDQRLGLKLSRADRDLLLDICIMDPDLEDRIRDAPARKRTVMFTLDELDALAGWVAAEANHTSDRRREDHLDEIYRRIVEIEEMYTDGE